MIARRMFFPLLATSPVLACKVNAKEDDTNRPLTPKEMEEYNRLLEQAKRIQGIIKTAEDNMLQDKNNLKKYFFERVFDIVENAK